LNAIANGQGPSVAGAQLTQGLEQIERGVNQESSDQRGNNGILARYAAINGGAEAASQANQSQALARATEEANARNQIAGILNNESNTAAGIYGTNSAAATAANSTAAQQSIANNQLGAQYLGAGLNGLAAYKAYSATTPGAGGSTSTGGGLSFTAPTDPDGIATLS
jgi:hypothetical protein